MTSEVALHPLGAVRACLLAQGGPSAAAGFGLFTAAAQVASELDLGEDVVWLGWELVDLVKGLEPGERRALLALVLATLAAERSGSTRLVLDGPGARTTDSILQRFGGMEAPTVARRLLADPRLAAVVGRPDDYRPLLLDAGAIATQRMLHLEERLGGILACRLARPQLEIPGSTLVEVLDEVTARPVGLSLEQRRAVELAVRSAFVVVTGGPGTGKTSIVVAILRALARLGVAASTVALAAPTGRAARRLGQSIERGLAALGAGAAPADADLGCLPAPCTIHRLLGYSPHGERFRHHERDPLPAQVVIVDESSMIDLALMERLLTAVRADARLVLLGDAGQLPSVEAGCVFRELAAPEPVRAGDPRGAVTARLHHSYRMDADDPSGQRILGAAELVRAGDADHLLDDGPIAVRSGADQLTWEGVELVVMPADEDAARATALGGFLQRWMAERVGLLPEREDLVRRTWALGPSGLPGDGAVLLDQLFDHMESHRLLCVTRGAARPTGALAINRHLHMLHRQALGQAGPSELLAGEPVLVGRNDYDRGLFNGDQGLILWVSPAGGEARLAAVFRRGPGDHVAFPVDALQGVVELAFAVTVHRAQGSEYDHVALVLPDEPIPLLTREVVYTAVTRARRSAVIVGRPAVLAAGVRQRVERASGLAARLWAETTGPRVLATSG